jgi:hypothetical protein
LRIDVPVYIKTGPKLYYEDGDACLKNRDGVVTWRYSGKEHTGIGIAACARSGTVYMTKVLKELGYEIGHEQYGEDGSVGYHLVAIRPDNCFHQVRHPLGQISSMVAHQSWGFMNDVIDIEGHGLLGCMQYWLKWNELCEEFCVWRYRIEDLPDVWDEFLERIGHNSCPLPEVPTNTNTHEKYQDFKKHTWADLFNENGQLAHQIKEKSLVYGYAPEKDKASPPNLRELETAEVA